MISIETNAHGALEQLSHGAVSALMERTNMNLRAQPAVLTSPQTHWMLWSSLTATLTAALCMGAPASRALAQAPTIIPQSSAPMTSTAESAAAAEAEAKSSGSTVKLPVIREKLANGLRIVMSPDTSVPTVAVVVYYDVGSRNEQKGSSGFAHLFEHMMFQGSANVAKGEHFTFVMNRGGSMNGTTSHDRTNYYETMPSNELELALWLESDRMRSLAITQENFENQRQTVMEERRQSYDNRPYMQSMLRVNELAYGDYFPYAHSTIGDMQDLINAPLSAVQQFFDSYYAPNNAVISIAGDFEPGRALQLVNKLFGDIAARPVPPYNPPALAPQTAERVETMQDKLAELPAFHINYHIPPEREPDHYALDMLSIVLGDGESSRLYQKLVKGSELVQEIDISTDGRRGPDLMSVWAIMSPGKKAQDARKVVYGELDSIAKKGITERELEKARNRIRSSFVMALQSNLQRAQRVAEFELYWGDGNLLNTEADKYLAVTAADVQRVAKQYFLPTNRTVLDVVPATAAEVKP
jgi:predicted Zn-dependent peptidase